MHRNPLENSFVHLGKWLRGEIPGEGSDDMSLLTAAEAANRWFTPEHSKQAMIAVGDWLSDDTLAQWMRPYTVLNPENTPALRIGLILAGNLPMVGWHDVLCVLLSGHFAVIKCSSSDAILIPAALRAMSKHGGEAVTSRYEFVPGPMREVDAVIGTGSNNTKRHFEYYFSHVPRILRGQRTSVAVLDGHETEADCVELGNDVFGYFGMGCRSVTKLFLPRGFDLDRLFAAWVSWSFLGTHNKYANNYDYHKAIWLLNQDALLENGFVLLKEDRQWVSPVGTLYYEFYDDVIEVEAQLNVYQDGLQCVIRRPEADRLKVSTPVVGLGKAQCPAPWDYADEVDTMKFLLELSLQHD